MEHIIYKFYSNSTLIYLYNIKIYLIQFYIKQGWILCNQLKTKPIFQSYEKIKDMSEYKFIIKIYKYKFIHSQ